jgi:uncharacterized alkaline shock family protein YloU
MKKISILDRVLLIVYIIFWVVCAIFALACSLGFVTLDTVLENVTMWMVNPLYRILLAVIATFVVAISVKLLLIGTTTSAVSSPSTILKTTEKGRINIAISAINDMAKKSVEAEGAIKTIDTETTVDNDLLNIHVKLTLFGGTGIPELTEKIQSDIKDYVESLTGLNVNSVNIVVVEAIKQQKARVS